MPFRVAIDDASLKDSSFESTVWKEPSKSVALKSMTG
jgi:hypothetical protein